MDTRRACTPVPKCTESSRELVKTVYGKNLSEEEIDSLQHEMVTQSVLFKWNWE
jgi:hypothetical protein